MTCRPYVQGARYATKAQARDWVRAAISDERVYRGCAWTLYTSPEAHDKGLRRLTAWTFTQFSYEAINGLAVEEAGLIGLNMLAVEVLTHAEDLSRFTPLDFVVPWEIHLIEDETAYVAALSSFLRESRQR